MDDVENLLHQAQLVSVAPALPPETARRALRGVRRRRQLQMGGVGGVTIAVVGGGALLASTRPDTVAVGVGAGGGPAPMATTARPAGVPQPSTPTAQRPETPASTPDCLAVKAHLAGVVGPAGYSLTSAVQPTRVVWQRGWLRSDKAHASLGLEAFCIDPSNTPPKAAISETVAAVTVQGHQALLTTDFGGSFARVTWSPNATTEVTVSANAFQPASWGRSPVEELKAARLTDAQLLAFAQTVPTS